MGIQTQRNIPTIPMKYLGLRVMMWLNHFIHRLYAVHVKEYVPYGFRSHVFVMRVTGGWPMAGARDSRWYPCLSITLFTFVALIYPLSAFINIFFARTIEGSMQQCFLAQICWANAFRAAALYRRRDNIRQLFRIHTEFTLADDDHQTQQNAGNNPNIHVTLTILFFISWCNNVLQILYLSPEERAFPSTLHLPYELAHHRLVYLTVLMYQLLCSLIIVFWVAMGDTFSVALINTACGHLTLLQERLRSLGSNGDELVVYKGLVECCERYETCLR